MKLFWAPQSRAFRTLWLLEETGAPYELITVDLSEGAPPGSPLRMANPMGKVPALEDRGVPMAESGAIALYVADRFPESGLSPALGDHDRATFLHWLFFTTSNLEPAVLQKMKGIDLPSVTAGWGSFDRVMGVLEARLSEQPYIVGERFTAVDTLLAADLFFFINVFKILEPRPAFTAYLERCASRPAFRRAREIEAEHTPKAD
ncbi:glutathione S-transferase family protein [Xanthobacteraceae bacterium A53D]